jgi:acetyl esterase/lipase
MSVKAALVALGLALTLAACSPLAVVNGLGSDAGIARETTQAYGELPRQQLDVYTPAMPTGAVVVFLYGGSWQSGARGEYRFVARRLAERGATVVIPDYRLYPEVRFPAFVEDAAAAVAWARRHARDYGGDPARVYLVGHSAGAHIATLLALDRRYLGPHGMQPAELAGVVGLSTPADFAATLGARYRPVFGDDAGLQAAQPVRYVNPDAPPLLLIHGGEDSLVWPKNSETLAEKQRAAGGRVELALFPVLGHVGTVTPFTGWFGDPAVVEKVVGFLGLRPD